MEAARELAAGLALGGVPGPSPSPAACWLSEPDTCGQVCCKWTGLAAVTICCKETRGLSCRAGPVHASGHTAGLAGCMTCRKTQGLAWVPGVHLVSAAAGRVTVQSLGPVGTGTQKCITASQYCVVNTVTRRTGNGRQSHLGELSLEGEAVPQRGKAMAPAFRWSLVVLRSLDEEHRE